MSVLVSEIVERKLYPRQLHLAEGKVVLELSKLDRKHLEAGFYLPQMPATDENELVFVNLDELDFDIVPAHQPAGFIFHLGRCGSTVTAKMLNTLENVQVISEARVLHAVIRAQMYLPLKDSNERRKKLMDLFCLLGESVNCKTIFKMASWEIRYRNEYTQLYPDVKSCLIVRNILEIMVALLGSPPRRYRRSRIRAQVEMEKKQGKSDFLEYLTNTFGDEVDYFKEQPYVDFIGNALKFILNEVKNSGGTFLIIDHLDIASRVPADLCALFGITPDKLQIQLMQDQARYNSKSKKREQKYIDDSYRKAVEATPEARRWCENTLQPLLDEIISKNTLLNGQ